MKIKIENILMLSIGMIAGCSPQEQEYAMPDIQPPLASVKPFEINANHGHKRTDNFYWLNERENQEVVDYLKAENQYLDTMMAHTKEFQEKLFDEMKGRIQEDDSSVPYKLDDYYYYTSYKEGGEYPVYCRKKGTLDAEEEIIMVGNELGKDKTYLNFFTSVSPDHNLAAIIMDTVGRNFYTLMIKDLKTGQMLPDRTANIRGAAVWTNDNQSFYYSIPDQKTLRNYQIKRHILGNYAMQDEIVFEEKDQNLRCGVGKTKSKK